MQSRSADGTAQSNDSDVYTVTLTCNDAAICGTEVYTATAIYLSYGLYSASLEPREGTYDVLVTMENAYTAAQDVTTASVIDLA